MSIDNIQELMKPRYKAIDGYPCSPYSIGDMVEFSTSGTSFLCTRTQQYDDFREDIVDVDNYFTIDALDKYPNPGFFEPATETEYLNQTTTP